MTGPAVPPGGEELRKALAEVVRRWWGPGAADPRIVRDLADAVLTLPAVRDALAAQEKVRRVEALADWCAAQVEWVARDMAERFRRALDGEPSTTPGDNGSGDWMGGPIG